jgi:transposase
MSAYSMDLRERIVAACAEEGTTQASVAQRFGVCTKTVQRYLARAQQGVLAPCPLPGKARRLSGGGHATLDALVQSRSDWTLESLAQELHTQTGVLLPRSTLHDAVTRLRLSHKKNAHRS